MTTASAPRRTQFLPFALVAGATLAADLATKAWATRALGAPRTLAPGFLRLVYSENRGIAWSMLAQSPETLKGPLLMAATALAVVMLVMLYAKRGASAGVRIGAPLVVGGALGNFVERVHHNYVVDFVDVHATWAGRYLQWPIFNVADIAICVGALILVLAPRTPRLTPLAT